MLNLSYTPEFKKRYQRLPQIIQEKVDKQIGFLRENPFHPSLHTEKLNPKSRQVWSFRIDRTYRGMFKFIEGDHIVLMTVGTHNWIYHLPF